MRLLVFLIEEPSMRAFLEGARERLPIPNDVQIVFRIAGGYQNMRPLIEANLRMSWPPNTRFVVLCDQDKADCLQRKSDIASVVPEYRRNEILVRIVCYELEAWYFGDPDTLSDLYPRFRQVRGQARFRSPDNLQQPATQLMELAGRRKRQLAEELGPLLDLESNHSPSLQVFLSGLRQLLAD